MSFAHELPKISETMGYIITYTDHSMELVKYLQNDRY